MESTIKAGLAALALVVSTAAWADTVVTRNNATLIGRIQTITADKVVMDTTYAGTIEIDAVEIARLEADDPLTAKLADGTLLTGTTRIGEDGFVEVSNNALDVRSPRSNLLAAWSPGVTAPRAAEIDEGHWIYSLAGDVTGKQGNSEEFGTSLRAQAALTSFDDELSFFTSVDKATRDGLETSDEMKLGSSYTAYNGDPWGWYVRSELERDDFEDIDIRATVNGGLSYRAFNTPNRILELKAGLGYRHESFEDGTINNSPTVNFGLDHFRLFTPWLEMTNSLTWAPAIDSFTDFLLEHDSGISMPIANTSWRLRLGLENAYQNEPAAGRKKLDTTYYMRALLNFN